MYKNRINLGVTDEHIGKEYSLGMSLHELSLKYDTRYGVIKRRVLASGIKLRKLKAQNLWSTAEDNILILLRREGFSLREISKGIFGRTHGSVITRIVILKRDRKVI